MGDSEGSEKTPIIIRVQMQLTREYRTEKAVITNGSPAKIVWLALEKFFRKKN